MNFELDSGNHLVSSMGVTYIYMYLNNSCMLLLTLNQYCCKCFKITSEQWVKGSNQFNKIKHYVKHEQARNICSNLEALNTSKIGTPKGNIKCLKKLCFTGERCDERSTYELQTIYASVGCWKKD